MSESQHSLFSTENIIKASGLIIGLVVQGTVVFHSVKTEIHDNKTHYDADKKILNYRLSSLEKCCGIKPKEITFEEND